MRFGQAFFGDIGRKHGLLASTSEDRDRFLAIGNRTDRPGYSPPDGPWPPYLSGFAHDGHYFLMRTFPDDAASRPGMVYTAAVVAPIERFIQIENLRIVVDTLPSAVTGPSDVPLSEIALDDSDLSVVRAENVPIQLAHALVTDAPPVVWGDPNSFDEIVINLWGRMWPSIRGVFSFRMSFDPNDIDQQSPPALVTTLPAIRSRWVNSPFIVSSTPATVLEPAVAVLTGDAAGDRLSKLRKDLESEISDFRQLQVLQVLAGTLDSPGQSFSSRRSQLQLAAKLSPRKSAGTELKTRLVDDLCMRIPGETRAAEIRGLRNIPWDAMPPYELSRAYAAVSVWVTANAFRPSSEGDSLDVLAADAVSDSSPWSAALRLGLQHALESDDSRIASLLWSWLEGAMEPHTEDLLKMYVTNSRRESWLADACPKLEGKSQLSKQVLSVARKEGWGELHASVALNQGPASAGLGIHLKYLKGADLTGIERFRLGLGNREFLSLSVSLADLRLLDSACRCLTDEPELWNTLYPELPFWRALLIKWASSAERSHVGTTERNHVVAKMLVYLGAREGAPSEETERLWEAVVKVTPDWSSLEVPTAIWGLIPAKLRAGVLSGTADGWLRRFLSGDSVAIPEFIELRRQATEEIRIRSILQESETQALPLCYLNGCRKFRNVFLCGGFKPSCRPQK